MIATHAVAPLRVKPAPVEIVQPGESGVFPWVLTGVN